MSDMRGVDVLVCEGMRQTGDRNMEEDDDMYGDSDDV
jgi:hypothetical protein